MKTDFEIKREVMDRIIGMPKGIAGLRLHEKPRPTYFGLKPGDSFALKLAGVEVIIKNTREINIYLETTHGE